MVCLGFEPGAARWKAQIHPLSYGGTPTYFIFWYPSNIIFIKQDPKRIFFSNP